MTSNNFTPSNGEQRKYRITFWLSLAAMGIAAVVVHAAYEQHVDALNRGEAQGTRMVRLGLSHCPADCIGGLRHDH